MVHTLTDPIAREVSFHAEALSEVPFCAQVVTEDTVATTITDLHVAMRITPMDNRHTALETRIHVQMLNKLEMESTTDSHRQLPRRMLMIKSIQIILIRPATKSQICA